MADEPTPFAGWGPGHHWGWPEYPGGGRVEKACQFCGVVKVTYQAGGDAWNRWRVGDRILGDKPGCIERTEEAA